MPTTKETGNLQFFNNYFTKIGASNIGLDETFPVHKVNTTFANFNSTNGSSTIFFADYKFSPKFITTNSSLDENNQTVLNAVTGEDRQQVFLGSRFKVRFRKLKVNVFVNTDWMYTEENNKVNFTENFVKFSRVSQKIGGYTNSRKGINYNGGVNYELSWYYAQTNDIRIAESIVKPYLFLTGAINDKKVTWSFGGEYAFYKTKNSATEILNLQPSITYNISKNVELSIESNNILNIESSQITENVNTVNYSETRITETLEGYVLLGVYFRI